MAMGRGEIFHAEVLNDENASVNNFIDINKIPEPELEEGSYTRATLSSLILLQTRPMQMLSR